MNKVTIQTPMWKHGGSVGVADRNFTNKGVLIEIAYKDKYGQRIYPHTYKVTKEKAEQCERMYVGKKNTPLRIIPINEMEIVSE
jgi:hypothetical protein